MRRGGMFGSILTVGAMVWGISMLMRSRNKGAVTQARRLLNRGMSMIDMPKMLRMGRRFTRSFAR